MLGAFLDPEILVKSLSDDIDLSSDRDWSLETLIYISLAIYSLNRLESLGFAPKFKNKNIVLPSLIRAWREALYQRQQLPLGYFSEHNGSTITNIEMTRFGNIDKKKTS
jgi:hypothetical protein